jgi:two-component system, NarL family, nitrate/nitrite response regulator NarL
VYYPDQLRAISVALLKILMGIKPDIVRIVIANEQQTFRESLRMILESDSGLEIVGEAFDARSVVELTGRLKPDILLLEFALSRELEVKEFHPTGGYFAGVQILIMVGTPEKAHIVEAFRVGAKGVVPKGSPPAVWFKSIRRIIAGKYFLGSKNVEILVQALQEFLSQKTEAASPNNYGLTQRELEIVDRIAHGCSNKEVGLEFSIRERTVKHHLTNIFNKVGVSSRLELALFARDKHILQSGPRQR